MSKKPEKTKAKKLSLKQQLDDITDTLKRVQAEFINYKNRVEKEFSHHITYSNAELIKKFLPLLDSFEQAMRDKETEQKIRPLYSQLLTILRQEGLQPIDAAGQKFDPYKHEVLLKEKSDKESETVLEELQKGYMLKDRVLRHSKVKISE
ncbi:nucleotide exchange factor GrpE [Candidatus Woesearchaeota archaeon]|nr:nucleotide exchange factor GrpE [Candidatus Woesearchaeota archaeon]